MVKVEKSHVPVYASTHAGLSGKNNEDNYLVTAYQMSDHNPARVLLAVLCDGVGGHQAGEVASTIGVNLITEQVAKAQGEDFSHVLVEAIQKASTEVNQQAVLNSLGPGRAGMGSTASVALLCGNRFYTATVGDSRIYLIRGSRIQQLSKDHTWIQDALDMGLITPEQVHGHPNAHVIRRYLGGHDLPQVDVRMFLRGGESDQQAEANQGARLLVDDIILICSDGLSDLVSESEIFQLIRQHSLDLPEALSELTQLANSRGGHDNITLIVFQVPPDVGASPPEQEHAVKAETQVESRKKGKGCLFLAIIPLLAAALAIILPAF